MIISIVLIILTAMSMVGDLAYLAVGWIGGVQVESPELCLRLTGFFFGIIIIYIFWNLYQFVKKRDVFYLKCLGLGLIFESLMSGLALFLPQDLYKHMKSLEFSDLQISLTYYFAYTPGNVAGGILGLLLLYLAMEKEKQNIAV